MEMAKLSHLVTINEQSLTHALFLDQRNCQGNGEPVTFLVTINLYEAHDRKRRGMQGCQAFDLLP